MKCNLASQGYWFNPPRMKFEFVEVCEKPWFSAIEKGTKTDWNSSSFLYLSNIIIWSDLIIHSSFIWKGFKLFGLKIFWSGQKFTHSGSYRLSVVNERSWACQNHRKSTHCQKSKSKLYLPAWLHLVPRILRGNFLLSVINSCSSNLLLLSCSSACLYSNCTAVPLGSFPDLDQIHEVAAGLL